MKAISIVLEKDKLINSDKYHCEFEKLGGVEIIEKLQGHPNKDIYERAVELVQNYGEGYEIQDSTTGSLNSQIESVGKSAFSI
jgi:predicted metal-dependent TIM-barrel fold hydrolase